MPMVMEYDFRLKKSHFKGQGWRGLAALGIVLTLRTAMVGSVAILAKTACASLIQLLQRLLGS
jgi:hypothetical protein